MVLSEIKQYAQTKSSSFKFFLITFIAPIFLWVISLTRFAIATGKLHLYCSNSSYYMSDSNIEIVSNSSISVSFWQDISLTIRGPEILREDMTNVYYALLLRYFLKSLKLFYFYLLSIHNFITKKMISNFRYLPSILSAFIGGVLFLFWVICTLFVNRGAMWTMKKALTKLEKVWFFFLLSI